MRIAWVEIRLRPNPHDWAVELWQWPHQNFVKLHKVKTAFFGIQIGPAELRFWLFKPGQYAMVPAGEKALPCGPGFLESQSPSVQGAFQR
jgi:hypothetical protein